MHKALNEQIHLELLNVSVSVLVYGLVGLLEFFFCVVVRRRKIFQDDHEEASSLGLVQHATVVCIEIFPDLVDKLVYDAVSFDLLGHPSGESLVLSEVRVIKEDLKIAWEALPLDAALIRQDIAVDNAHVFWWLSGSRFVHLAIVVEFELRLLRLRFGLWHFDTDLTTAHILGVSPVGLNTSAGTCLREDTRDAECATVGWIRDPSDVNETIIHGSEGIQDHSSVCVFSVVYGHKSRVKLTALIVDHVVDGQRVGVLHEPTA